MTASGVQTSTSAGLPAAVLRVLHERQSEASAEPGPASGEGSTAAPRSTAATIAVRAMFFGTVAKMGLDIGRVLWKAPEAFAARSIPLPEGASALREAMHARVGRLPLLAKQAILTAPDTRIIDPLAPAVRDAMTGRSYTRLDSMANRISGSMGLVLAAAQLGVAIPNLIDGIRKDGVSGLGNTTSGRTGVVSLVGGALGMGVLIPAFRGAEGATLGARLLRMAESPHLTSPLIANIGIGLGLLTAANEFGFLDFFNKGDDRPVGTVLSDSLHSLPRIHLGG